MSDPENREDVVRRDALDAVIREREHQEKRWDNNHDAAHSPDEWVVILARYLGKAAAETPAYNGEAFQDTERFKKRLTQIAAISVAALEALSD